MEQRVGIEPTNNGFAGQCLTTWLPPLDIQPVLLYTYYVEASNKLKDEQLGMPFGTANGRLRKLILFNTLKKHNENICYRCNEEVKTPEELSIDHKEPWFGVDPALFWDMDNIAFSHLSCNIKAMRRDTERFLNRMANYPSKRDDAPPDTKWCYVCKAYVSVEEFTENAARPDGLQDECKPCRSVSRKRII